MIKFATFAVFAGFLAVSSRSDAAATDGKHPQWFMEFVAVALVALSD